jgi:hypothetical protein
MGIAGNSEQNRGRKKAKCYPRARAHLHKPVITKMKAQLQPLLFIPSVKSLVAKSGKKFDAKKGLVARLAVRVAVAASTGRGWWPGVVVGGERGEDKNQS